MFKRINAVFLLTICSSICVANQTPSALKKFIPNDWEILSQANGDLNQDGAQDTALIIQPKHKNQQQRKLLVLFQLAQQPQQQLQLKLARNIPNWTYRTNKQCVEDALDESALTIKNQRLDLQFNTSPSCANTYSFIHTYGFKLKNKQFHLVGFDTYSLDKLTGKQDQISLNFLTGKAKLTTIPNIFAEIETPAKVIWKTLKSTSNDTLENISFASDEFNHQFSMQYIGEKP